MYAILTSIEQLKRYGAKKGAWAVVTGATDGIGKEFAIQLAKAGFNVMLVARNKELLSQTAGEIGMNMVVVDEDLVNFAIYRVKIQGLCCHSLH